MIDIPACTFISQREEAIREHSAELQELESEERKKKRQLDKENEEKEKRQTQKVCGSTKTKFYYATALYKNVQTPSSIVFTSTCTMMYLKHKNHRLYMASIYITHNSTCNSTLYIHVHVHNYFESFMYVYVL